MSALPIELERFTGVVNTIRDGRAYVTLRDAQGDELIGQYPAWQLEQVGVVHAFECRTELAREGHFRVVFTPKEQVPLTPEVEQAIDRDVDEVLDGWPFDGDD
jgi:hypothetical protein